MGSKQNRRLRAVLLALGILAAVPAGVSSLYRLWETPPSFAEGPAAPPPSPGVRPSRLATASEAEAPASPSPAAEILEEQVPGSRREGVYTILLAGSDAGNGNTDTLILGRLDTLRHRMDFVSIPRDTLINSPWEIRKINAVYWGARNGGGDGIAALKAQVARLTGFEPDCCAVADLELFVQVVDLIGGVPFDVPMDMDYEDASQDLSIHLKAGPQLLDGSQAMGLCRYRSGYVMGDLDRIDMQQQFLRACLSRFLSLGAVPRAPELIKLLAEGLDTDLSAANMAYLLRQALQCRGEDVRFLTAPSHPEIIAGYSYAVLDLQDWLDTVNDCLNPFDAPIGRDGVDVVYRSGSGYAGTAPLRDPGYYSRGGKGSG